MTLALTLQIIIVLYGKWKLHKSLGYPRWCLRRSPLLLLFKQVGKQALHVCKHSVPRQQQEHFLVEDKYNSNLNIGEGIKLSRSYCKGQFGTP